MVAQRRKDDARTTSQHHGIVERRLACIDQVELIEEVDQQEADEPKVDSAPGILNASNLQKRAIRRMWSMGYRAPLQA